MTAYEYHPKDHAYLDAHGLKHFCYYVDLIVACNRMGCDNFVDGLLVTYQKTGSMRKTGAIFGLTQQCVGRHLHRMGAKINPPGGWNRPHAKRYQGRICPKCGTDERYESTTQCCECMRRYNQRRQHERRSMQEVQVCG